MLSRLESTANRQVFNKTNQLPPFSIPEFKYSPLHIRLLHSIFDSIETDVRAWKSSVSNLSNIPHLTPSLLLEIQPDPSLKQSIIQTIKYSPLTLCISSPKWPIFSAMPREDFYHC